MVRELARRTMFDPNGVKLRYESCDLSAKSRQKKEGVTLNLMPFMFDPLSSPITLAYPRLEVTSASDEVTKDQCPSLEN